MTTVNRFDQDRYLREQTSLVEQAEERAADLRSHRENRDWEALAEAGRALQAEGERWLAELLRGRTAMNEVQESLDRLQVVEDATPTTDADPAELDFEAMAEDLRELRAVSGGDVITESLVQSVEAGEVEIGEGPADLRSDLRVTGYAEMLREQRQLAIWYATTGFITAVEAALYRTVESAAPTAHSERTREVVEDEMAAVREGATERFRAMYGALAARDWGVLARHARESTAYPVEVWPDLRAVAGTLREGRRYEAEGGAAGQEAAFAGAETALHGTVRLLALLLEVGHRFLFVAREGGTDEESREAAAAAVETHFESLVVDGVNVDVDDLLDAADEYDGRLVETEGFAEDVHVVTEDGFGTAFDLVDRLHDRRVAVFYPYRDLTDYLLHEGAYVQLNGEFEAESDALDGEPLVQVDTVSLVENGEESWFDRVAGEYADHNGFELYPGGGNLCWSMEPPRAAGSGS